MKVVKNQLFFEQRLLIIATILLVTLVLIVLSYHDFIKLLNKNQGQSSQSSTQIRIGTPAMIIQETEKIIEFPRLDISIEEKKASLKDEEETVPIIKIYSKVSNLDGNVIRSLDFSTATMGGKAFITYNHKTKWENNRVRPNRVFVEK